MTHPGDKIILTPEGMDLLNENDLKLIIKHRYDEFTIESLLPVMISDDDGNNRRLVNEAYSLELPDTNLGLEGIHWTVKN